MTQQINLMLTEELRMQLLKHKDCGESFDAFALTGDLIMTSCAKCNTKEFIELSFHPTETEGYDILTI
jgi:hypothetical protein